jgi:hypothetical protein
MMMMMKYLMELPRKTGDIENTTLPECNIHPNFAPSVQKYLVVIKVNQNS